MNQDAELQQVEEHTDEDIIKCLESRRCVRGGEKNHMECFVKFAEKSHSYNIAEVMKLHILLKDCHTKRQKDIKQTDTRDLFRKAARKVESTPRPKEHQREPQPGPTHETSNTKLAECMQTTHLLSCKVFQMLNKTK